MASQDWFEKDFYKTLGVSPDADDAEIKKAYRKLARANHPDQHPGDDAAEQRFKEIGEAYQVLSDAEDRKQYDAIRQMAAGGARFSAGGGPGAGGAGGFEDVFSSMFGGGGGGQRVRFSTGGPGGFGGGGQMGGEDLEDILRMFGGAGAGGFAGAGGPGAGFGPGQYGQPGPGPRPHTPQRGENLERQVTVGFRQAMQGDRATVRQADGSEVTVKVPAGVKDGQKIRLKGKGHPSVTGGPAGDLMITVQVRPHDVYRREGDNLVMDLPVTFAEAALGAVVQVPTWDGASVKVKVAPGTPSGRRLRIRGRGAPTASGAGDLLAEVQVAVPSELTEAQRQAVEALRDAESTDPRADLASRAGA